MSSHLAAGAVCSRSKWMATSFRRIATLVVDRNTAGAQPMLSVSSSGYVNYRVGDGRQAASDSTIAAGWVASPGDLIVNPMWLIGGGLAVTELCGAVSPDYRVYRFESGVHPRYMHHLLRTPSYVDQYRLYTRADTTFDRRVSKADFHEMPVLLPPIEVQRRVADFLDDQVALLDHAIQLRQVQASLLEVAYSAHLSSWVLSTKRLVPLRRLLASIVDGPFGSSLTSAHYSDEGARVIRLGNVGTNVFKSEDAAYIPLDYYAKLQQHDVLPGDLLIAGLGDEKNPLGRACLAPQELGPAIVKADCYRVRLDRTKVSHPYAALVISSTPVTEATRVLSRGATRERINTEVARDIAIPVPSLAEQASTVAKFAFERTRVDRARADLTRSLELLQERKQALITAAVTGEFDVSTASVRGAA